MKKFKVGDVVFTYDTASKRIIESSIVKTEIRNPGTLEQQVLYFLYGCNWSFAEHQLFLDYELALAFENRVKMRLRKL